MSRYTGTPGPLSDDEILNIIDEELQQSAGGNENDFIDSNRKDSLAYYLGQKNGKEIEGRSQVVSTDVADAIEWIMPEVVEAFTQNNEVVTFDANGADDELQAEMESQFVYDIFMKQNNGFLALHENFKDALMQKNGIFKCYIEEEEKEVLRDHTGLTIEAYQILLSRPDVEPVSMTQNEDGSIDALIVCANKKRKIKVITIPPEEFRLNRMHDSIDLSGARFQAHVCLKTQSDLIAEGFDREIIDNLPGYQTFDDDRDYRFYMQNETVYPQREVSNDKSQRYLEIAECYIHIDIDGTGIAQLKKITVAGGDSPDAILSIEDVDDTPFVGTTAILMSHKFFGLSIYDRLKQIQDQKTTLWRNILDNIYLQNNGRVGVIENQVNIDDLLVSRPGGVVRMKTANAIQEIKTPPVGAEAFQMLDYLDQVRAGRVGADPNGKVDETNIGERVGSEGVEKIMNGKEAVVGLMIRVFAEIGIKPLMCKIRDLAVQHYDAVYPFKFRGDWIQTRPQMWGERSTTTVRVGTGSGNRQQQIQVLQAFMGIQERLLADPRQAMVNPSKIYNAIADFGKWQGIKDIGRYFIDPMSDEGKKMQESVDKNQQQMQQMQQQLEGMQAKATADLGQAEVMKAQAQQQQVMLKEKIEMFKGQLAQAEFMNKAQKEQMQAQLDFANQQLLEAKAMAEASSKEGQLGFQYNQMFSDIAMRLTELEAEKEQKDKEFKQNKETAEGDSDDS